MAHCKSSLFNNEGSCLREQYPYPYYPHVRVHRGEAVGPDGERCGGAGGFGHEVLALRALRGACFSGQVRNLLSSLIVSLWRASCMDVLHANQAPAPL